MSFHRAADRKNINPLAEDGRDQSANLSVPSHYIQLRIAPEGVGHQLSVNPGTVGNQDPNDLCCHGGLASH